MRRPAVISLLSALIAAAAFPLCGCRRGPAAEPAPAARPGPAPVFADVTEAAGIRYRWEIPGKRPLNILQTIGNGCAFLDYDNDGALDVLLVGPKPALFRGNGKGRFEDVTGPGGMDSLSGHFLGCAVGDYDNDGFVDVYLSAYRGGALLRNEAGKAFRDVTRRAGIRPQPWGTSCAWGDIDGDGRLDLYVGNYVQFGPSTRPRLCRSNGIETGCGPDAYKPERGVLYRNQGGGLFRDVTRAWGADRTAGKTLGVAFVDYDGSGRQSLAVANDGQPGDLFRNRGGRFENAGTASGTAYDRSGNAHAGMGVDWGDYDNDGLFDLTVMTFRQEAKCVYRNDGGAFVEMSPRLGLNSTLPYVAFGVRWLDYDNDGWLDLMITNGHVLDNVADINQGATYRQPTQLFRNTGGSSFEEASARLDPKARRPIVGRGLATGDYDNDGRVDALAVDSEGTPLLLHNESGGDGHGLSLRLIATTSNRDGLGALVTVEAGGRKLVRHCHTDGSYLSSSDKRVHIGLGTATQADRVTVRWPSGRTDTLRMVPADQVLTLREGSGVPDASAAQ